MTTEESQLGRRIIETFGWGNVLVLGDAQAAGTLAAAINKAGLDAQAVTLETLAQRLQHGMPLDERSAPAPNQTYDIVACIDCLERIPEALLDAVLLKVMSVARRHVFIRVGPSGNHGVASAGAGTRDRAWWESRLISLGLRKHPRYYFAIDYESLEANPPSITVVMEKPPSTLCSEFPLSSLAAERDLHMDMTREQGRRSDAHMIRYHKAAAFVREGDRVLDTACGLGYGSHILASNSLAGGIIGIDGSDYGIRYAKAAFSEAEGVEFRLGVLPGALKDFEDGSIDFIASFETLEHLEDPEAFLLECHRILSPGGRLMTSVPHDWSDADGHDPNPYHFHVYDWAKFHELIGKRFVLEKGFIQTASRKKVNGQWQQARREWREAFPAQCIGRTSEWCISLSMKSPLGGAGISVDRPISPYVVGRPLPPYLDFNRQYENPWLIRGMISIGLRMTEPGALSQFAQAVEKSPTAPHADGDAAACVLAYAWLSQTDATTPPAELLGIIDRRLDRLRESCSEPVDVRWKVSLLFVAALIRLAAGDRHRATRLLDECLDQPYMDYSILLGTKVAAAALQLGIMFAADGDIVGARRAWGRGLAVGRTATALTWDREFGGVDDLPDFVLRELTTLFDLVTQCAAALRYVKNLPVRPPAIERIAMNKAGQAEGLAQTNRVFACLLSAQEQRNSSLAIKLEESQGSLASARDDLQRLQTYIRELKAVIGDAAKSGMRSSPRDES